MIRMLQSFHESIEVLNRLLVIDFGFVVVYPNSDSVEYKGFHNRCQILISFYEPRFELDVSIFLYDSDSTKHRFSFDDLARHYFGKDEQTHFVRRENISEIISKDVEMLRLIINKIKDFDKDDMVQLKMEIQDQVEQKEISRISKDQNRRADELWHKKDLNQYFNYAIQFEKHLNELNKKRLEYLRNKNR